MSLQHLKEQEIAELMKKWKNIEETMTGHISGRKIWCVDSEDEDAYMFVDETLKSWLSSHDLRLEQAIREDIRKEIEYKKSLTMKPSGWDDTSNHNRGRIEAFDDILLTLK